MIVEVAARVPASLAAYRGGVAVGPGGPAALPLAALREPAVFDAALAAFAAGFETDDRCALVSYWSQFYLAALATPALTALVRLGRPLPLAFDATHLELDAAGRPARFLIADGDDPRPEAPGLAGLVEAHLRPFVETCRARCGIAPRVLWGNAAVILDYVAGELEPGATDCGQAPACAEIAACLGWRDGRPCARAPRAEAGAVRCGASPLAQVLRADAAGRRRRRACCLRRRLPGIPSCGALCPLDR